MASPSTSSQTTTVPWPSGYSRNPAVDGLLAGVKWGGGVGSGVQLDYSFPGYGAAWPTAVYGTASSGNEPWNGFRPFDALQQSAAMGAMQAWGAVANINPRQVADTATNVGDIRFGFTSTSPGANAAAFAYYPASSSKGGDIWMLNGVSANDRPLPGSYGYHTLLHEIGHAIGLKHSFSTGSNGAPAMPASLDGLKYAIMAYADRVGAPNVGANTFPTTPMLFDIAAAQYLYGANAANNAGDSVYSFFQGSAYWQTIWDGGGNDTIRWVGSSGVTINLNPGTFSTLGNPIRFSDGVQDPETVAIAYGAWIERAVGGSGADTLIGHAQGNVLVGAGGNDLLIGGGGADVFRFERGSGRDVVADFAPGLDRLEFAADLAGSLRLQAQALPDVVLRAPDGTLVDWQLDGARIVGGGVIGAPGGSWLPAANADFTGDGRADFVMREAGSGAVVLWAMDGKNIVGGGAVASPGATWNLAGVADFNGDGRTDILMREAGGSLVAWRMDGRNIVGGGAVAAPEAAWKVATLADFNGDGRADILLRNDGGALLVWSMADNRVVGGGAVGNPGAAWKPVGVADFNADGRADILMRGDDGTLVLWAMNGNSIVGGGTIGRIDPSWNVAAWQDFSADGQPDILLRNAASGQVVLWNMAGTSIIGGGGGVATPGAAWKVAGVRDFDQDGRADVLMRSDADGAVALWQLSGNQIIGGGAVGAPGAAWEAGLLTQLTLDTGNTIVSTGAGDTVTLQGVSPGALAAGRDWVFA